MRPNSRIISCDQSLTGRGEKKASLLLCRISYLVGVWHALWLVKLHHTSITCSLRHPILSFFVDTQCDPVWCNLPPSTRRTTPCVTLTVASRCCYYTTNEIQKPSYANGLRWLRQTCCTHFLYSALSDLLISYLPVSCRVAAFEYDFVGWIS